MIAGRRRDDSDMSSLIGRNEEGTTNVHSASSSSQVADQEINPKATIGLQTLNTSKQVCSISTKASRKERAFLRKPSNSAGKSVHSPRFHSSYLHHKKNSRHVSQSMFSVGSKSCSGNVVNCTKNPTISISSRGSRHFPPRLHHYDNSSDDKHKTKKHRCFYSTSQDVMKSLSLCKNNSQTEEGKDGTNMPQNSLYLEKKVEEDEFSRTTEDDASEDSSTCCSGRKANSRITDADQDFQDDGFDGTNCGDKEPIVMRKLIPRYFSIDATFSSNGTGLSHCSNSKQSVIYSNFPCKQKESLKLLLSPDALKDIEQTLTEKHKKNTDAVGCNFPVVSVYSKPLTTASKASEMCLEMDELVISSQNKELIEEASNLVAMHMTKMMMREKMKLILEDPTSMEVTLDLTHIFKCKDDYSDIKGIFDIGLGCEVVDLSTFGDVDSKNATDIHQRPKDVSSVFETDSQCGVWIHGVKAGMALDRVLKPSLFKDGAAVTLLQINDHVIMSTSDLVQYWESAKEEAIEHLSKSGKFQLTITLCLRSDVDLECMCESKYIASGGIRQRDGTPIALPMHKHLSSPLSCLESKIAQVSEMVHSLAQAKQNLLEDKRKKNFHSWHVFRKKMACIIDIEFDDDLLNMNAIGGYMWRKHKSTIGEHCSNECQCASHVPFLCENVVSEAILKLKMRGRIAEAETLEKKSENSVGFVSNFYPRFYPRVRSEFTTLTPSDVLTTVVSMWNWHKQDPCFGVTCREGCFCASKGWAIFCKKLVEFGSHSNEAISKHFIVDKTKCFQSLKTKMRGHTLPVQAMEMTKPECYLKDNNSVGKKNLRCIPRKKMHLRSSPLKISSISVRSPHVIERAQEDKNSLTPSADEKLSHDKAIALQQHAASPLNAATSALKDTKSPNTSSSILSALVPCSSKNGSPSNDIVQDQYQPDPLITKSSVDNTLRSNTFNTRVVLTENVTVDCELSMQKTDDQLNELHTHTSASSAISKLDETLFATQEGNHHFSPVHISSSLDEGFKPTVMDSARSTTNEKPTSLVSTEDKHSYDDIRTLSNFEGKEKKALGIKEVTLEESMSEEHSLPKGKVENKDELSSLNNGSEIKCPGMNAPLSQRNSDSIQPDVSCCPSDTYAEKIISISTNEMKSAVDRKAFAENGGSKDSFAVTFDTRTPLGFYCISVKIPLSKNLCKILSVSPTQKDPRLRPGMIIVATSGSVSGEGDISTGRKNVSAHGTLKRRYEAAQKNSFETLNIWFTYPVENIHAIDIQNDNDESNYWTDNGSWRGPSSIDGWAGGADQDSIEGQNLQENHDKLKPCCTLSTEEICDSLISSNKIESTEKAQKILRQDTHFSSKGDPSPSIHKLASKNTQISLSPMVKSLFQLSKEGFTSSVHTKSETALASCLISEKCARKKVTFKGLDSETCLDDPFPRNCVTHIDNSSFPNHATKDKFTIQHMEGSTADFDLKSIQDFALHRLSPAFANKKKYEDKAASTHSWVEKHLKNSYCKLCEKRKDKVLCCEFCRCCHACGIRVICPDAPKDTDQNTKVTKFDQFRLLDRRYQEALRSALGLSSISTTLHDVSSVSDDEVDNKIEETVNLGPCLSVALHLLCQEPNLINLPLSSSIVDDLDNIDEYRGKTLLFAAVMYSDFDSVLYLILAGADIRLKDCRKKRPVDYAKERRDSLSRELHQVDKENISQFSTDLIETKKSQLKDFTLKCKLLETLMRAERLGNLSREIRNWYTIQVKIAKAKNLQLTELGKAHPSPDFLYCNVAWDGKKETHPTEAVPLSDNPDWTSSKGYCFRFNSGLENTFRGKLLVFNLYKGELKKGKPFGQILKLGSFVEKGEILNQHAVQKGTSGMFSLTPSNVLLSGSVLVNIWRLPYDKNYENSKKKLNEEELSKLITSVENLIKDKKGGKKNESRAQAHTSSMSCDLLPLILGRLNLLQSAVYLESVPLVSRLLALGCDAKEHRSSESALEIAGKLASITDPSESSMKILNMLESEGNTIAVKNGSFPSSPTKSEEEINRSYLMSSHSKAQTAMSEGEKTHDTDFDSSVVHQLESSCTSEPRLSVEEVDAKLPILEDSDWMKSPSIPRCKYFHSQKGCKFGAECRNSHVHILSKNIPVVVSARDSLHDAYKVIFDVCIKKSDYTELIRKSDSGKPWNSCSFLCPVEKVIYYAAGGTNGIESTQGIFWYPSPLEARHAVNNVVLDSFRQRKMFCSRELKSGNENENVKIPGQQSSCKVALNNVLQHDHHTVKTKDHNVQDDSSDLLLKLVDCATTDQTRNEDNLASLESSKCTPTNSLCVNDEKSTLVETEEIQEPKFDFKRKHECEKGDMKVIEEESLPTYSHSKVTCRLRNDDKYDDVKRRKLNLCQSQTGKTHSNPSIFVEIESNHSQEHDQGSSDAPLKSEIISISQNEMEKETSVKCLKGNSNPDTFSGIHKNSIIASECSKACHISPSSVDNQLLISEKRKCSEINPSYEELGFDCQSVQEEAETNRTNSNEISQEAHPKSNMNGSSVKDEIAESKGHDQKDEVTELKSGFSVECLPIIEHPDWMLTELKRRICFTFNAAGCDKGRHCRYAHVHAPRCPPLSVCDDDTLSNAYERNFNLTLKPSDFHLKSETDKNNHVWHTAAFCCPHSYTIYYAAGGTKAKCNFQNVWWYPTKNDAKLAVEGVVLADFEHRGLFFSLDSPNDEQNKDEVHTEDDNRVKRLKTDSYEQSSVSRLSNEKGRDIKVHYFDHASSDNEIEEKAQTDFSSFSKFGSLKFHMLSMSSDPIPSQPSVPELPNIEKPDWMLVPPRRSACFAFNSNRCTHGSSCKYAHVYCPKGSLPELPPEPGALSRAYDQLYGMNLKPGDYHVFSEADSQGKLWYTAAIRCPVESTIYYASGGPNSSESVQSLSTGNYLCWYPTKDNAKAACEGVILYALRDRGLGILDGPNERFSSPPNQRDYPDHTRRHDRLSTYSVNRDVELPLLPKPDWMLAPPKYNPCFAFNSRNRCTHGMKCKYAHVFKPKCFDSSCDVPDMDALYHAYMAVFGKELLPSDFHEKSEVSRNNVVWCTAAFRCPMEDTIYYASGGVGMKSPQNLYWYPNLDDAKAAIVAIVLEHFRDRNLYHYRNGPRDKWDNMCADEMHRPQHGKKWNRNDMFDHGAIHPI